MYHRLYLQPRREEDRVDHKAYKEIKDKLRRQKERAKLKDHVEKLRKHRRSNKSKSHSRHGLNKTQPTSAAEMSPMSERKIKDTFRINMANVMVHFLNPYRKNDCKQGRITNTEDFKHLARKVHISFIFDHSMYINVEIITGQYNCTFCYS